MADERVAVRYAKSLIDLGQEQGVLDVIHDDMMNLKEALTNRDLQLLVKSPIIKSDKKISVFRKLFGESYNKITMAFFEILTKKSRENILPEIAKAFISQYKKLKHVSMVKLTTASPLGDAALAEIKSTLLSSKETDEKVEIETAVDPNLIGGFVLELGDKLYDASVAYKLDQIKRKFSENKYIKST